MPGDHAVRIARIRRGIGALVEKLKVVGVNRIGLVIAVDEQTAAAERSSPSADAAIESDVVLSQKWSRKVVGIAERGPRPAEAAGPKGSEVTLPAGSKALDVRKVLSGSLDAINIVSLEHIELAARVDDHRSVEAIGKVPDRSRATPELSAVVAEEQIAIG